ncbi:ninjurin-1-like isoform X2 [Dermacentor albipictus]|uniref:ninjurin-1-like isoform X2 n=1 Tax=Dermacentor albipictus TaxID=60249 RepID=UPI0031FDA79E
MSGSYELHQPTSHATSPPLIPEESPPFSRGGSPTANGDGPVGPTSMTKTGWVRTSASMNPNLYATKKTLAQGMLDVALLSVNATQLKTIIQRGDEHDFYTVLVVLISLSIALQILVGMVFLVLGFVNLNKDKNHRMAEILNNVATAAVFAVTVLNILTASFDSRSDDGTNFQRRPSQAQPLVP